MTIADLIKQVSASQRLVDDAMKGLSMNRIQAVMDQAQKIESVLTMAHTCVAIELECSFRLGRLDRKLGRDRARARSELLANVTKRPPIAGR